MQSNSKSFLERVVTPWWIRLSLPLMIWRKKASAEKRVYLTFDDGPTKEVTDQLLDILQRYNAKATFFCLGENVQKHRAQFAAMIAEGHLIGNHSHRHLNGWKTSPQRYVDDVAECQSTLVAELDKPPAYFRPPFGRISIRQFMRLRRKFEIVMWDILSLDYRTELTGKQVADNVIENAKSGSIIVLHDSTIAADRVVIALPLILEHFSNSGFKMCTLDQ